MQWRSIAGESKGQERTLGETSLEVAEAILKFIDAESVIDALLTLSEGFEGFQYDFGKGEEDIFFVDPPFFHLAEYARRYEDDFASFVDDIEAAKDTLVYTPPFDDDIGSADLSKQPSVVSPYRQPCAQKAKSSTKLRPP